MAYRSAGCNKELVRLNEWILKGMLALAVPRAGAYLRPPPRPAQQSSSEKYALFFPQRTPRCGGFLREFLGRLRLSAGGGGGVLLIWVWFGLGMIAGPLSFRSPSKFSTPPSPVGGGRPGISPLNPLPGGPPLARPLTGHQIKSPPHSWPLSTHFTPGGGAHFSLPRGP